MQWDFGDGAGYGPTDDPATYTYTTPGTRTVKMLITDSGAETTEVQKSVRVNAPPAASFTFPSSLKADQQVTFTSDSSDADGDALTYAWDLDDGTAFDDGTGSTAQRSFPTDGSYTVRLRVSDGNGGTDISSQSVTIQNSAPVASFSHPANLKADTSVTFTSTRTDPDDGDTFTYEWDLDNDAPSTPERPAPPPAAHSPPRATTR